MLLKRAARKIQQYIRLTLVRPPRPCVRHALVVSRPCHTRRPCRPPAHALPSRQARKEMKKQCRGVLQKQSQIAIPFIGGMELVVWQVEIDPPRPAPPRPAPPRPAPPRSAVPCRAAPRYASVLAHRTYARRARFSLRVSHPTTLPYPARSPIPAPPAPQPRFVYATDYSICYQRLRKDRSTEALKRTGDCGIESSTRVISFREVLEVRAVLGERLLVVSCNRRVYKFAFKSQEQCEQWANNLVQLINVAGYMIQGFIEMPPDDDEQTKRQKRKPVRKRAEPLNVY